MKMRFEFTTAMRIVFGAGTLKEVGALAREFGWRALVATGKDARRAQSLLKLLDKADINATVFSVSGEPTMAVVGQGVALARKAGCTLVIGFGGGSAVDAGKAIAAMLPNGGQLLDYLEVIGRGQALMKPSAPYVAIPTTAGTGAEVTRNAVLASPEHRVKVSLRSSYLLPKVALVDPELTYDLPPALTASTGLASVIWGSPFGSRSTGALCRKPPRSATAAMARDLA